MVKSEMTETEHFWYHVGAQTVLLLMLVYLPPVVFAIILIQNHSPIQRLLETLIIGVCTLFVARFTVDYTEPKIRNFVIREINRVDNATR